MHIFTQSVTTDYNLNDATWELIIMLTVAFMLGWAFNYFWSRFTAQQSNLSLESIPKKFIGVNKSDLKIIEGIGPKIEELLKSNGLKEWRDVASADIDKLRSILTKGGDRFQMHDPSSWADQAALAAEGKWLELEEYQNLLIGGRSN